MKAVGSKRILLMVALIASTVCMVPDLMLFPVANTLYELFDNEAGVSTILSATTFISMFVSFGMGPLMLKFDKKKLLLIGIICFFVGGVFGGAIQSLNYMIAMRGLLGFSLGMCNVASMAIVSDFYSDETSRSRAISCITGGMSLGAMILTAVAGNLAANFGWTSVFKIGWYGIIPFILVLIFVPKSLPKKEESVQEAEENGNFEPVARNVHMWKVNMALVVGSFFFACIFGGLIQYQNSVYIAERGIGNESVSGFAMSVFSIGSLIACLTFGFIYPKLKKNMSVVIYALLVIGYTILMFTSSATATFVAMCCVGLSYGYIMSYFPTRGSFVVPSNRMGVVLSTGAAAMGVGLAVGNFVYMLIKSVFGIDSFCGTLPVIVVVLIIALVLSIILSILDTKYPTKYYMDKQSDLK